MVLNPYDQTAPIPSLVLPQADDIRLVSQEEALVCISDTLRDVMLFEPRYYINGIPGAIPRMYVRETVRDMLQAAADALPAGYKLKVFDAWRPAVVQASLFWQYFGLLSADHPELSRDELMKMARYFVSFPSENPTQPFVHATGGAVDLTIVDENGTELDMGTDFDDFTEAAYTAAFESSGSTTVRDHRRLLYNVMRSAGFTNYPYEWWHFDYGDRFWAALCQKDSIYTGIYTEPKRD